MLSSLLHLTPLFLQFWNPGSSKAGKSSWWLAHDCRLVLQPRHTIHSTEKKITFQRHSYHDCSMTILWLIQERSYLNENSEGVDFEQKCYWWARELRREKYGFLPNVVSHSSFSFLSIFLLFTSPTWLAVSLPPSLIFCLPDIPLSHSLRPFSPLLKIGCSYKVPAMKAFAVTSKIWNLTKHASILRLEIYMTIKCMHLPSCFH